MSEIKVNSIKGVGASAAAITVNNTDGTCTANITNNLSNRNLIINGAMQVSQRGTSFSGTAQRYTLDRMQMNTAGNDEIAQTEQAAVTSGGAYTSGFRKCLKIINGNQTSGAGATDIVHLKMVLEAQDIANSGWNYTSSSSFVTLSFWIKSSVAQDFPITLRSEDGTRQVYNMTTGSLSADTWTKITKTIPGNSNLQFDDNNAAGLTLFINAFVGTDYTTGGLAQNAWSAWSSAKQGDNMTSTWYTTNDATLEITGLQLEVGSVATDFEHRSFSDELRRCQRYYFILADGSEGSNAWQLTNIHAYSTGQIETTIDYSWANLRAIPALKQGVGTNYYAAVNAGNTNLLFNSFLFYQPSKRKALLYQSTLTGNAPSTGVSYRCQLNNVAAYIAFDAEL